VWGRLEAPCRYFDRWVSPSRFPNPACRSSGTGLSTSPVRTAPGPAGLVETVDYKGRQVTVNELQEIHSNLAGAVGELEKTWFDLRQQFFLGYAQAPSIRNLILVSATMQRRCQVFRTMGLPSARSSLAMWQQAALAQEGAAMGEAVQKGTNNLIQGAFKNSADAVEQVAKASQMPIINGIAATQVARNVGTEIFGSASAAKPFRRC
jgi:uncharacterized protein YaaN involved in tellurite resistance